MIPIAMRPPILFCLLLLMVARAAAENNSSSVQQNSMSVAQNGTLVVQEEVVAAAPPKTEMSSRGVVKSAHHMAWVEKQGNLHMVFLDGKQQGGHYNEVAFLQFSPDETHFVFATRSDTTWWLVYDGKDQQEQYFLIGGLQWQPKGNTLAYTACREKKKCQLYLDGKASGPEYEYIAGVKYSQDGKHLAYMGWRHEVVYAVLDGKQMGSWMENFDFNHWGFSRTGRFYVAACHGRKFKGYYSYNNEKWTYVVDGVAGPQFGIISPIEFSPDDQHYTYAGLEMKLDWTKATPQSSIVLDGKVKTTYSGKKIVFGAHQLNTGVRDLYPRITGMSNPSFDPGGKLVYAAKRESGDVAVFVGEESGQGFTEIVSPIVFSPDGQHFAYVAQQDDNLVEVHDNHPGITFQVPGRTRSCFVEWMEVTREPEHHLVYELVCAGKRYKLVQTDQALRRMVIDGRSGPEYDVAGLHGFRHSQDWKHYGYEVHGVNGNQALLNIDGKETKAYDGVVAGSLEFHPEAGEASFIAREGGKLIRVKWPLQ
jgi:hypothetical protein